jgi:hypothetical protein
MMTPLWIRALRELKLRMIFALVMMAWSCTVVLWVSSQFDDKKPSESAIKDAIAAGFSASTIHEHDWWLIYAFSVGFTWLMMGTFLAGAGVNTQTTYGLKQGTHPSMLYTLSLPVRRRDLVLTRSLLGALLAFGLTFLPAVVIAGLSPLLTKFPVPLHTLLIYSCFIAAGGMALYWLSVLFASFLDEQWQLYTTWISAAFIVLLGQLTHIPVFNTFVRFSTGEIWIRTHTISWSVLAIILALSVTCLVSAVRIVEQREY